MILLKLAALAVTSAHYRRAAEDPPDSVEVDSLFAGETAHKPAGWVGIQYYGRWTDGRWSAGAAYLTPTGFAF